MKAPASPLLLCSLALCFAAVGLGAAAPAPAPARPATKPVDPKLAEEKETTTKRMQQIYDAIQAYRREKKDLPAHLSDLFPQFISDTNVFLCPTYLREKRGLPASEPGDPKLTVHFGYDFSARPIQNIRDGSPDITMADWKRMQMMVAGGIVPMLRCYAYDRVINISFDGRISEGQFNWERDQTPTIRPSELDAANLKARLVRTLGFVLDPDIAAFEEVKTAAAKNRKAPVNSLKPFTANQRTWNDDVARNTSVAAELAAEFVRKFPKSPKAAEAATIRDKNYLMAIQAGSEKSATQFEAIIAAALADRSLPETEHFEWRMKQLSALEGSQNGKPAADAWAALEKPARALVAEFPKRIEPYQQLLRVSRLGGAEIAKAVSAELAKNPDAPEELTMEAKAQAVRENLVGSVPDIKFTAVAGREVDLATLRGKVVLVDFWATWCGPCIAETPAIKAAYDKYHDKGFEIVGISFDQDKAALEKYVAKNDIAWPHHFDGSGFGNKFGRQYGITGIPEMWLINQEGKLVDMGARHDLAGKVAKLLEASKP